jgi:hypothetical protein
MERNVIVKYEMMLCDAILPMQHATGTMLGAPEQGREQTEYTPTLFDNLTSHA